MNRWVAVTSAVALAGSMVVPTASAEVQEEVWRALKGQRVYVETKDGTSVSGTLGSVEGKRIGVLRSDGIVAVVEKERVNVARGISPSPAPIAAAAPPPALPWRPAAPPPILPPPVGFGPLHAGPPPTWYPPPPPRYPPPRFWPPPPVQRRLHAGAMSSVISTIELTPPGHLLRALIRNPDASHLHPHEQAFLFARYRDDGISAGGATVLNMLVPGLGGLLQRDYVGGLFSAGMYFGGVGLLAQSASCRYRCGSVGGGAALAVAGWLFGIIRPWFYESPRARALKRFFTRRVRVAGTTIELQPSIEVAQGTKVGEEARMAPPLPGGASRTDVATATQVTAGIEARF